PGSACKRVSAQSIVDGARCVQSAQAHFEDVMKATAYLKLSGSLIALTAAAVSQADAQTTGWTGGSSFHTNAPTAGGAGGGTPIIGDNLWHNPLNWGGGTPNAGVDVSIGL